jgi:hypothetical protein
MFKRIFGQGSGGGGGVGPKPSVTSTVRTVDAIQKLGEVSSSVSLWSAVMLQISVTSPEITLVCTESCVG